MNVGPGLHLEDDLTSALVDTGHQAHVISLAHHLDPGSNGFTFGIDRYHRATELSIPVLNKYGFLTHRRGAGLVATRPGLELQFAVARGIDLSDPTNFDADSSLARRNAGKANAAQLSFDDMPGFEASPVVHIVWSGTPELGQTAVHAGRLVLASTERLDWAFLVRLDTPGSEVVRPPTAEDDDVGYVNQPEPALGLALKRIAHKSSEG